MFYTCRTFIRSNLGFTIWPNDNVTWSWGSNHLRQTTMWAVSHSCLVSLVFRSFFSSLKDKNNLSLTARTEKGFNSLPSGAQIHTSSCVSVRERWRTRPPLFFQQTCARPQTRSRELPASVLPASGKHRAQKATAAEKQEKKKNVFT